MLTGLESQRDMLEQIAVWGQLWGVPAIEQRVALTFSVRQRRSLGRCIPATGVVRLNARLLRGPVALLTEVLCHELAHVAAYELHGRCCRPHGREWAALMRAAGFRPQARASLSSDVEAIVVAPPAGRNYEHRCPVCRAVRFARRSVRQWRCGGCMRRGLSGELSITKHHGERRG